MTSRYTTYNDALHHEVIVPLGEHVDDFDVNAIGEEVIGTEGTGVDYCFVCTVDETEFWKIVERHAIH